MTRLVPNDGDAHFLQEVEPNGMEGGHCLTTAGVQQRYLSSAKELLTCLASGRVAVEPDHLLNTFQEITSQ